jgi:transcriptional regulator of heat shock response
MGVLGILGSKRMEYSRMMSLVDCLSDIITRQMATWEEEAFHG